MVRQPESPYNSRPERLRPVFKGKHKVTAKPSSEPIDLTEAKLHLRVDHTLDDTLINALNTAAREYCEKRQSRAYIQQTWTWELDFVPVQYQEMWLPLLPLISVESIEIIQTGASTITVPASQYDVDLIAGRIVFNEDYSSTHQDSLLPLYNCFKITYKAGYGSTKADVPEMTKAAIKLILGHWYEHREEATDGREIKSVPIAAERILDMERVY